MNTHIIKIKQNCGDVIAFKSNLGFMLSESELMQKAKKFVATLSFEERKGEIISIKEIIRKDSESKKQFGNPRN